MKINILLHDEKNTEKVAKLLEYLGFKVSQKLITLGVISGTFNGDYEVFSLISDIKAVEADGEGFPINKE